MTTAIDRLARMPKGQPFDLTVCLTCPDGPHFESEEFGDHLLQVHGIDADAPRFCRMSLDNFGTLDFHVMLYLETIGDVEAERYVQTPRHAESKAYWREGVAI